MGTSSRYPESQAWLARARRVIPGGHHLSGRPLLDDERSPRYFQRAQGCRIQDVDGREYIDYLMAYGAFVLGYAHEGVDRAAFDQAGRGNLVSLNHPLHVTFVEALLERFPFADMGMFFKTGSEATSASLRVARRATGRRKIVRAGYHGWHDWCLPLDESVASGLAEQILEFQPNEAGSLDALLAHRPGEVAAVILAPEMVLPLDRDVIASAARSARRHGAVFILDEVKTALRIAPGSIHQRLGLTPDLMTLSKGLGNGWPVAAVLGTRAIMEAANGMHLSATYHGDVAAMAAAMATMSIFDSQGVADHLFSMGERLIAGLTERARNHGLPVAVYGEPLPPMPFMRFTHPDPGQCRNMTETFYEEVLARGILLHPRHMWFISQAHSRDDIDRTLDACDAAFAVVKQRHQA